MKSFFKITSVIILSIFALIVIYNSILGPVIFAIPSGLKKETVCFLAPGLTWNSTMSDVGRCFGEPVENDEYNDTTGTVTSTYKLKYGERPMTVYAVGRSFLVTMPFHRMRVFRYRFIIECHDGEDTKKVFKEICDKLISSKSSDTFLCDVYSDEEFSANIGYGPTYIHYDADFSDNNVYFRASAIY